ncbi:MAG: helix-turn-helix domain-containing protein, partial [Planctomycetaceae bacterium]|nr:helix-turn-helix domain-containing protein [Planctomycetaceae bacterium]
MRGRKPTPLSIGRHDRVVLQDVAWSEIPPWYQVRRARTVLAIAAGPRTAAVAAHLECDVGTVRRTCQRYRDSGVPGLLKEPQRPGRPAQISPPQRARIVELACLEPVAKGLHITHWSSEDLARQAVADGIVEAISPRTVRRILDHVDLQPHRTRSWRTTRLDPLFKSRAEKVLWCYANAERLA